MTARRLPDFVVIGGRKCGTTWLDGMLRQHSQIHLPTKTKELFFFDRYWDRGLDWYADQFADAPNDAIIGEVTPSYLHCEAAAARLAQVLPEAKLIVVLRNPIDRAWSDYLHAKRKGDVRGDSFEAAIRELPSIVTESRYASQLEPWLSAFPRTQLRLLYFEHLFTPSNPALRDSVGWLGGDESTLFETDAPVNAAKSPRSAFVSQLAHRASRLLHASGLHRVVDSAKRSGLTSLLEKSSSAEAPAHADSQRLEELLGGEPTALRALLKTEHPTAARGADPPW